MKAKIITKNYVKSILRRYNKNNRIISDYRDYRNRNNISINKEEKEVKLVQFLLSNLKDTEDIRLIEQRFINNKTAVNVSLNMHISERQIYAKQEKILKKMAADLDTVIKYKEIVENTES